jgi:carbamoyltransferase
MSKKHVYVLGLNAYDHDVSACLLRDGEIAFAISKERITRKKHDTGFYETVADYCLTAEGIALDEVDLVVRKLLRAAGPGFGTAHGIQDVPEVMDDKERMQAAKHPLFLADSAKVVTVSHHLADAYAPSLPAPSRKAS